MGNADQPLISFKLQFSFLKRKAIIKIFKFSLLVFFANTFFANAQNPPRIVIGFGPPNYFTQSTLYGGETVYFPCGDNSKIFAQSYQGSSYGFEEIDYVTTPSGWNSDKVRVEFPDAKYADDLVESVVLYSEKEKAIWSLSKEEAKTGKFFKDKNFVEIDTEKLNKGVYYLHIQIADRKYVERLGIELMAFVPLSFKTTPFGQWPKGVVF